MAFGMIMRNSKLRTSLYVLVAGGMCLAIYLLRSTHSQLNETKTQQEACLQQKDSLLAQMQVVFEQKNRVDKYLQQERQDHKQTKTEHQKSNELRLQTEKDKREIESKYTDLQKEHQLLQEKLDLQLSQLQEAQTQKEEEKKQLQSDLNSRLQDLQNSKNEEIEMLKGQINTLHSEKEKLQQQNQVQEWELNKQVTSLQFCQSKQNELKKQLDAALLNETLSKLPIPHPQVKRNPDPSNEPESPKGGEILPKEKQLGVGINSVVNDANNQQHERAQLPAIADSGDRKQGGGAVGGGNLLPENAKDVNAKAAITNVPPLKLPKSRTERKTTTKKPTEVPAPVFPGLFQQIQPPNADFAKKPDDEKSVNILDPKKDPLAGDMRLQMEDRGPVREDHLRNFEPKALENPHNVENHLIRPYLGPNVPFLQRQWPAGMKRGPQPDHHNVGQMNQLEDHNDYGDEGDDDNAEEQDGDNDHVNIENNKKPDRDQDFDDQDNADGADNNHAKEEGVMLAPK